jgi:hypothetical protein
VVRFLISVLLLAQELPVTRIKILVHALDRFTLDAFNPQPVLIDPPRYRRG